MITDSDDRSGLALSAIVDCEAILHHRRGRKTHERLHIQPRWIHDNMAEYHRLSARALEHRVSAIAYTLINEAVLEKASRMRGTQT